MTMLLIVLLPFLAVAPAWGIGKKSRLLSTLVAAAASAGALVTLATFAPDVMAGEVLTHSWPWIERIGLELAFRLDGLAMLFGGLILGIGTLVIVYGYFYLHDDDPIGSFYATLMTFMGAMMGVVMSENVLLLVMFWELTSISSFLLIGYWKHLPAARQGARMALSITGGGGLALLGGVILLGHIVGSYDLTTILASNAAILDHDLYPVALVLILLGAFTKSAQLPFHFWLPNAMSAPTPVSAYLHSATMVKAGVFLLARMHPALSGSAAWFVLVTGVGLVTFCVAAYIALFERDLKGLLAYSTISHLGLITACFGFSTKLATMAGRLPHHEPRGLQGLPVHVGRDRRPRGRHSRHAGLEWLEAFDAHHLRARDARRAGHGRRPPAERVPLQGDVLRGGLPPDGAPTRRPARRL